MKKAATIIECLILLIGVLISLSGTFNAVKVSASYIPCFLFAVMGIVFIAALLCGRSVILNNREQDVILLIS